MQALPSIFMSMTLYVTGKNNMTLCVTASMTLYVIAKFCMTLCITSLISLKIGCMTQKCMTQKYRFRGFEGLQQPSTSVAIGMQQHLNHWESHINQ